MGFGCFLASHQWSRLGHLRSLVYKWPSLFPSLASEACVKTLRRDFQYDLRRLRPVVRCSGACRWLVHNVASARSYSTGTVSCARNNPYLNFTRFWMSQSDARPNKVSMKEAVVLSHSDLECFLFAHLWNLSYAYTAWFSKGNYLFSVFSCSFVYWKGLSDMTSGGYIWGPLTGTWSRCFVMWLLLRPSNW